MAENQETKAEHTEEEQLLNDIKDQIDADEQQPPTVINEFTQKTEIVKLTVVN